MDRAALVTLRVGGLVQALDEPDAEVLERAARRIGASSHEVRGARFARRSVDARKRPVRLPVQVDLVVPSGFRSRALQREERSGRVRPAPLAGSLVPADAGARGRHVVVVGTGPAGIFAALPLALGGARVTVLERGADLGTRHRRLVPFHRGGTLDPETNLLFGEGGAGTYSDGKLYTRVDHPLEVPILEELVAAGAPAEILFDARAHVGTDRLHTVLPALRRRLQEVGVEFRFDSRLDGLRLSPSRPGRVQAVEVCTHPRFGVGDARCWERRHLISSTAARRGPPVMPLVRLDPRTARPQRPLLRIRRGQRCDQPPRWHHR